MSESGKNWGANMIKTHCIQIQNSQINKIRVKEFMVFSTLIFFDLVFTYLHISMYIHIQCHIF